MIGGWRVEFDVTFAEAKWSHCFNCSPTEVMLENAVRAHVNADLRGLAAVFYSPTSNSGQLVHNGKRCETFTVGRVYS